MNIDISGLNENQRQAVEWDGGALLVLAGPGSGKTRVLTYRIANILERSKGRHFKILGLTFTNKAAGEMRERLESIYPGAKERTLLTTFHAFCADILRQHGSHIGLRPDYTILSQEADRESVLDEVISYTGCEEYSSQRLLPLINRLMDYCVRSEDAEQVLEKNKIRNSSKIAAVYKEYRKRMIQDNSLDFGGLIAESLALLEDKPAIKKQLHKIYHCVCVDEFQDTNLSQYRILKLLVSKDSPDLFIVADDDQIIYQWNGASPERLRELQNDFNISLIQLPENYRCPENVIKIANKLIKNNLSRAVNKKELKAVKLSGNEPVRVKSFKSFSDELNWVANDIVNKSEKDRSKCVIIGRARKLLESAISALQNNGLNGYIAMRKNEFQSAPMIFLHSMLRLANSRQDREQIRRVCKSFYSLEGIRIDVRDVVSFSSTTDGDYLRAWAKLALNRNELEMSTRAYIKKYLYSLSEKLAFWQFIEETFQWVENIGGIHPDSREVFYEYKEEVEVWQDLVNDIFGKYGKDQTSLHLLLQELDLNSKTPDPPSDAIHCYTIQSLMGLEFEHVYMIGLAEDQLPSWGAIKKGDNSHEMQEERRNCFVAITRTLESLTMTYANEYFGWAKQPSRFLYEMGLLS
ncbi:MAG: ATP-dependent helicase [Desulfobacterales bacterium]|nr:ATP-dependent helicase [Desulfobacterales bacterium]